MPSITAHVEPNDSVPPPEPQPSTEVHPQPSTLPDKVSAPSPLRISLDVAKRNSDVDPSAAKSPSPHHSDSVIYGDEVLYVEDELKYTYPRERLPFFSTGVGIKGPLFNRTTHPVFFQESPYNKPEHLILLDSRLKNRRYTTLVFFMTA